MNLDYPFSVQLTAKTHQVPLTYITADFPCFRYNCIKQSGQVAISGLLLKSKSVIMKISIHNRVAGNKLLPAVFFLFGLMVFAVSCSNDKKAAIAIGGEWYKSYCVSCHGENGDGQTQIGANLNPPPQDLRQIAKRRNGVFPDAEISKIIAGKENVPGHTTTDMPIWWESFKKAEGVYDDKSLQEKIDQITAYLKTIQEE